MPLAGDLSDHDGDAELAMAGPVRPLTLLAAVSDGVTIFTHFTLLQLLIINLVTLFAKRK